jgi:hypothetical protein
VVAVSLLNSENSIPNNFSGDIEAGLTQSGFYFEGNIPLAKNSAQSDTKTVQYSKDDNRIGYRIGIRRTYYEFYAPIINKAANIDFFTFPQSTDYQFVLDGVTQKGTWQFYLLGAYDRLGLLGNLGTSLDSSGKSSFDFKNYYETTGYKFSTDLGNGYGFQITFQQLYNTFHQSFFDNSIGIDNNTYSIKSSLSKTFSEKNNISFGFVPYYEVDKIKFDVFQLPAPGSGSQTFDPFTASRSSNTQDLKSFYENAFIDYNWKPIAKLKINPGIQFSHGGRSSSKIFAVDPRLGIRYELVPGQTLKAAAGYYSERPAPQYNTAQYGNPDLDFERTQQFIFGYETKILSDWSLDVQTWYKQSFNLVGPAVVDLSRHYENSVPFRAKGLDLFLKKDFLGRYYGWISYSLSQSEKRDPLGGSWHASDYDRTHVINLVGNAKVTNRWLLGTRIQYMTGTPYTGVSNGLFNQNTGRYIPSNNTNQTLINANNDRFPAFFQVDIRSDYDFLFDNWKLDFYVEVNNVTNKKNVSQISYSKDYSQKLNVYSFPILPSIGAIASF